MSTRVRTRAPRLITEISPEELLRKTGYSPPHTPFVVARKASVGVSGIFLLDCEPFEIRGQCEMTRRPQAMSDDFW